MNFRRSIPTFVFGLSIGLLLGVAFFLFKINDIFTSIKDTVKDQVTVIEKPSKESEKEEEQKKNKERFKINIGKTSKVNYKEVDSLIRSDNDLNVATEELVSVKSLKVIILTGEDASDSTAVRSEKESDNSSLCFVEFWKTPLNSKGYRFGKNKLMLYGFTDTGDLLIYELDRDHYLKVSDQVYKLDHGSDFRKLEKVIDSDVLARIN